jgi:ABC-2 type transport system permease protein
MVRGGKADMAWIFEGDLETKLQAFLDQPKEKNAMVTVLLRQDDVTLRLAREKLSGALYQALSRRLYISFVRENVPELASLSDDALLQYYNTHEITDDLFAFDETDASMASVQTVHYLTAPVRGLLAVVIALCGMATAMYYVQDTRRGTFSWVSTRALPAVELGCQLVSLANVTAVVLLALVLSGQSGSLLRELAAALLYCLCCAAFCALLRRLCGSVRMLGAILPLLVVVMLVICPVFFDFGSLRAFQYLLPPTYFINAVYSTKYLLYMAGYTGICLGLYSLLGLARE